jgi:hypothetical protein
MLDRFDSVIDQMTDPIHICSVIPPTLIELGVDRSDSHIETTNPKSTRYMDLPTFHTVSIG